MYYFKLITKIPSPNKDWKEKLFFDNGTNWVCGLKEVSTVKPVDCTWGVLPKSGESSGES